jgi:hypothetical protein
VQNIPPEARALLAALKGQPGVQGVAVSEDAVGRHAWIAMRLQPAQALRG